MLQVLGKRERTPEAICYNEGPGRLARSDALERTTLNDVVDAHQNSLKLVRGRAIKRKATKDRPPREGERDWVAERGKKAEHAGTYWHSPEHWGDALRHL